jgi:hypothetical protein
LAEKVPEYFVKRDKKWYNDYKEGGVKHPLLSPLKRREGKSRRDRLEDPARVQTQGRRDRNKASFERGWEK